VGTSALGARGSSSSGRLDNIGLASSFLIVIDRELASTLRGEDEGLRSAADGVAVLAIFDRIAFERRKLDVVGGNPGSAGKRSVNYIRGMSGEGRWETYLLHFHWWWMR
jgi:hypothetical protein